MASVATPATTPHHHHQHHYHYSQERIERLERHSPAPFSASSNYLQTPTKTSTIIRVVTKPIESIMIDGENPFRPEGELFKEADAEIHDLIRSQSVSPLPKHEIEELVIPKEVLDREFPLLANREPISSNGPTSPTVVTKPQTPTTVVTKEPSPKPDVSTQKPKSPVQTKPRFEDEDVDGHREPVKTTTVVRDVEEKDSGKKKKKKRKVGCGGDSSCSIM